MCFECVCVLKECVTNENFDPTLIDFEYARFGGSEKLIHSHLVLFLSTRDALDKYTENGLKREEKKH